MCDELMMQYSLCHNIVLSLTTCIANNSCRHKTCLTSSLLHTHFTWCYTERTATGCMYFSANACMSVCMCVSKSAGLNDGSGKASQQCCSCLRHTYNSSPFVFFVLLSSAFVLVSFTTSERGSWSLQKKCNIFLWLLFENNSNWPSHFWKKVF